MTASGQWESGGNFNPAAMGDPNKAGQMTAMGIYQDHASRPMTTAVPDWKTNPMGQHEYAYGELQSTESAANKILTSDRANTDLTYAMHGGQAFERPSGYDPNDMTSGAGFQQRLKIAQDVKDKYGDGKYLNGQTGANATTDASGNPLTITRDASVPAVSQTSDAAELAAINRGDSAAVIKMQQAQNVPTTAPATPTLPAVSNTLPMTTNADGTTTVYRGGMTPPAVSAAPAQVQSTETLPNGSPRFGPDGFDYGKLQQNAGIAGSTPTPAVDPAMAKWQSDMAQYNAENRSAGAGGGVGPISGAGQLDPAMAKYQADQATYQQSLAQWNATQGHAPGAGGGVGPIGAYGPQDVPAVSGNSPYGSMNPYAFGPTSTPNQSMSQFTGSPYGSLGGTTGGAFPAQVGPSGAFGLNGANAAYSGPAASSPFGSLGGATGGVGGTMATDITKQTQALQTNVTSINSTMGNFNTDLSTGSTGVGSNLTGLSDKLTSGSDGIGSALSGLENKLGSAGGGGGGGFGNILGSLGGAGGGTGGIGAMHTGGTVGSPMLQHASASWAAFIGARRYHTGGTVQDMLGLKKGEVPIIAKQGEQVLTENEAKNYNAGNVGRFSAGSVGSVSGGSSSGGGDTHLTVHNHIMTQDANSFKKSESQIGYESARTLQQQMRRTGNQAANPQGM